MSCPKSETLRGTESFWYRGELSSGFAVKYFLFYFFFTRNRVFFKVDGETGETMTAWQYLTESLRLLQGMKGLGLKQNDTVAMMCRNSFPANEIMLATWLGALPVAPINGFMKVGKCTGAGSCLTVRCTFSRNVYHLFSAEMRHIFDLIKPKLIFCEEQAVHNVAAAVESLFLAPIIVIVDKEEVSVAHTHTL